ncbi:hypothetical protein CEXT_361921 [Caerostris extrusa]|uniref:Uncharacterized protein n=1 Tax=Caerostris extrusa TaxID=172846 RepID=A0AAV4XZR7_CAEEX|nr:hypothetical protein CEXT_361921 [Caerostris extrusa]
MRVLSLPGHAPADGKAVPKIRQNEILECYETSGNWEVSFYHERKKNQPVLSSTWNTVTSSTAFRTAQGRIQPFANSLQLNDLWIKDVPGNVQITFESMLLLHINNKGNGLIRNVTKQLTELKRIELKNKDESKEIPIVGDTCTSNSKMSHHMRKQQNKKSVHRGPKTKHRMNRAMKIPLSGRSKVGTCRRSMFHKDSTGQITGKRNILGGDKAIQKFWDIDFVINDATSSVQIVFESMLLLYIYNTTFIAHYGNIAFRRVLRSIPRSAPLSSPRDTRGEEMDDTIHHFQLMNRWFLQRVEKEPPPLPPASEREYCHKRRWIFYSNVTKRIAPGSHDERVINDPSKDGRPSMNRCINLNSVLTDLKDVIYEREGAFCLEKDFHLIGWLLLSNVCDSTKRGVETCSGLFSCDTKRASACTFQRHILIWKSSGAGVKKWRSLHPRPSNPRQNFPTLRDKEPALDRKSPALISNSTVPAHTNAYFFERKKNLPRDPRVIGEQPIREPPTGRTPKASILLFTLRTLSFLFYFFFLILPTLIKRHRTWQALGTGFQQFYAFPPSLLISRVSSVRARS